MRRKLNSRIRHAASKGGENMMLVDSDQMQRAKKNLEELLKKLPPAPNRFTRSHKEPQWQRSAPAHYGGKCGEEDAAKEHNG